MPSFGHNRLNSDRGYIDFMSHVLANIMLSPCILPCKVEKETKVFYHQSCGKSLLLPLELH